MKNSPNNDTQMTLFVALQINQSIQKYLPKENYNTKEKKKIRRRRRRRLHAIHIHTVSYKGTMGWNDLTGLYFGFEHSQQHIVFQQHHRQTTSKQQKENISKLNHMKYQRKKIMC